MEWRLTIRLMSGGRAKNKEILELIMKEEEEREERRR